MKVNQAFYKWTSTKDYSQIGLRADWACPVYLIKSTPTHLWLLVDYEDGHFAYVAWCPAIEGRIFNETGDSTHARDKGTITMIESTDWRKVVRYMKGAH